MKLLLASAPSYGGLSRMEGLWERSGNGMGMGWEWGRAHPFEISPPGCLEVARLLNSPLSTHPFETTGGGGGAYLERVCPSPPPPHSHPVPTPFPQHLHSRQAVMARCIMLCVVMLIFDFYEITEVKG